MVQREISLDCWDLGVLENQAPFCCLFFFFFFPFLPLIEVEILVWGKEEGGRRTKGRTERKFSSGKFLN